MGVNLGGWSLVLRAGVTAPGCAYGRIPSSLSKQRPHHVNTTRRDGDGDDADRIAADVERCSRDLALLRLGDGHESVGRVELFVVLEVRAQIVENYRLRQEEVVWATTTPFARGETGGQRART